MNLEKAVIHEKHEIYERNQKDMQLRGVTGLVNYCFAVMVSFFVSFRAFRGLKSRF